MARKLWTIEEDDFLRENYSSLGAKECSKILDRTEASIAHRARKYGLKSSKTNRNKVWSEKEKNILREYYPIFGLDYCKELLPNRTSDSIYTEAYILQLKNCNVKSSTPAWTHDKYENTLLEKEINVYPLERYIDSRTAILHSCIKGHKWKAKPSNTISGSGCPTCAKSGFDINKPAILYYIKIVDDNINYYKIGITNRSVAKRFEPDKDKAIIVLLEKFFPTGILAKKEEQDILTNFKSKRITVPGLLKSKGNTELFMEDILGLDND